MHPIEPERLREELHDGWSIDTEDRKVVGRLDHGRGHDPDAGFTVKADERGGGLVVVEWKEIGRNARLHHVETATGTPERAIEYIRDNTAGLYPEGPT